MVTGSNKKIWIDLDNSPHVPLFRPIIEELQKNGSSILVTARDCFQVCELCDLHRLEYHKIGRHYGKNKVLKVLGLTRRALQLMKAVAAEKPDLALSHGSRSQLIAANLLKIPAIIMDDYEHSRPFPIVRPDYMIIPEVIPESTVRSSGATLLKYPGIKEDIYVPYFEPEPSIRDKIGLAGEDLLVLVRPPATEAHYHKADSETLFAATMDFLYEQEDPHMKVVILPRNQSQTDWMRKMRPAIMGDRRFMIPKEVLNGLNLIWHSDLVISGGGTMNREATALGVPVYSIFRGEIGAIDKYLANEGKLILIEDVSQVRNKIALRKRKRPAHFSRKENAALSAVVGNIEMVINADQRR